MTEEAARETEREVDLLATRERLGGGARAHAVVYLGERSSFLDLAEGQGMVLGRSEEADVQLKTPSVSRKHLVLRWADGQLSVQDCGSTNGTFVNGQRLRGEVPLAGGDEITAGDALIVVGVTSPRPPLVHRVSPSEAFEERLGRELIRAARLGRMLALVRARFEGPPESAAQGLAALLSALPGQPIARAIGPSDYQLLVDEGVESVRGICEAAAAPGGAVTGLRFGVALFPRDGQDRTALLGRAEEALAHTTASRPRREEGPVAEDPVSRRVFSLVDRLATSDGTVLIVGETGAGKEVVAVEIHRRSARAKGPFVPVNCGAIPSTMFAREMFGHERGAFTGAADRRAGFFEAASGGTLFLDEVAEIPLADQAHLLRAIEGRVVTRLGGTKQLPVDIRVLAATNRDLREQVARGLFRQDLLYRLDVLTIVVPALRDRPGDIGPLARRFLADLSRAGGRPPVELSKAALSVLERHGWPGNVRELRNVIERLALLASSPVISDVEVLDVLYGRSLSAVDLQQETDLRSLLEAVERAAIGRALDSSGGNQTIAAARLGISRRTLIYRMQRYGFAGPRSGRDE